VSLTVRKVKVRKVADLPDRPGAVAEQLATAAANGVGLAALVAYVMTPGESGQGWLVLEDEESHGELADMVGCHVVSDLPAVLVTGENLIGAGAQVAKKLASAGLNARFMQAMGVGPSFAMLVGFRTQDEVSKALELLAG
jgi:hypothetical protein